MEYFLDELMKLDWESEDDLDRFYWLLVHAQGSVYKNLSTS